MEEETIGSWLSNLAARTPAPGGGAAAALAAATSAALIGMVANYTTGKKWADRENQMKELSGEAAALRLRALSLANADAEAFASVGAAYKLPGDTAQDKAAKTEAIQVALVGAAEPPKAVAKLSQRLVELCDGLVETSNPNVISDVAVASSLAAAALESAIVNIEINEQEITDMATKKTLQNAVQHAISLNQTIDGIARRIRNKMRSS